MNKLLYYLVIVPLIIFSQEKNEGAPFVSTSFKKLEQQWVGQKLDLYVELHSPTWFSGTPRFDIPEIKEAVIFKIPGSPVLGNLEKDGQTYTKQIHTFAIFTRKAGRVTIPAFQVEYGIARVGKKAERVTLKSKPISIETQLPKSLSQKSFIVSENYQVDESWDKDLDKQLFKAGDSIKRTITQTADNNLAMIFSPIIIEPPASFSIYPEKAKLNDSMVRGDFSAKRIDAFTYLFKEEGKVTLPAIKFYSFNPNNKQIKEHLLESRTLKIAPNPLYKQEQIQEVASPQNKYLYWLFSLVPILALLLFRTQLKKRVEAWKQQRKLSEKYIFSTLKKNSPRLSDEELYIQIDFWVKKFGFISLEEFIQKNSFLNLGKQYRELNHTLFTVNEAHFDKTKFMNELCLARREYLKNKKYSQNDNMKFLGFDFR
ncbi:BatD family protein [Lentisphaera marina]|uniref:BatD family protein n=1 Tax=Lentisphaera marina TaxID=1111041 RepID=UPI002366D7F3|nr:BatD family protein [Lentisphaera marina]MDD7983800.1 BatD family protein [Lentisphaera marina]